jgi:acylpyruvate hydrolase
VNTSLRQSCSTSSLLFKPDDILAYISKYLTLEAGDIIITGTPQGSGPVELGDVVQARLLNHEGQVLAQIIDTITKEL